MRSVFLTRSAVVLTLGACAWWLYPSQDAAPTASDALPTAAAVPLAFPIANPPERANLARTGNGLFGLGPNGELIFDARSSEQLEVLARSLPLELTEQERQAIDEFAAVGLHEPQASEARGVVHDFLAGRGIGPAHASVQAAATPVPEILPEALIAIRPVQPEGDGVVRFPGMGDESAN